MREINKKVYEIAGFEFDELEFEDGPPPIDGLVLDNSNHSIDQLLTDQQVEDIKSDSFSYEDYESGSAVLNKKAAKLNTGKSKKPVKAGGATRTNISITNTNVKSKSVQKSAKISGKTPVKKRPLKKTTSKQSMDPKLLGILLTLAIAIAYLYFNKII